MRHPLHPAIVHFPVACWSLAVGADFAGIWFGEAAWQWSGGLLTVGCAMALVAVVAGMMELPRVPEGAAMRDTYIHMAAMLTAFALFTTRLLLRLDHYVPQHPDAVSLTLDLGGFLALAIGGWFGGRLVYPRRDAGDLVPYRHAHAKRALSWGACDRLHFLPRALPADEPSHGAVTRRATLIVNRSRHQPAWSTATPRSPGTIEWE